MLPLYWIFSSTGVNWVQSACRFDVAWRTGTADGSSSWRGRTVLTVAAALPPADPATAANALPAAVGVAQTTVEGRADQRSRTQWAT